jgi:hypothetical protein
MRAAPAGTPQAGGGVTDSYGFRAAPLRSASEGQPIKMGAPATGRAMKDREGRVPTVPALPRSLLGKKYGGFGRAVYPSIDFPSGRESGRWSKWPHCMILYVEQDHTAETLAAEIAPTLVNSSGVGCDTNRRTGGGHMTVMCQTYGGQVAARCQ